MSLIAKLKARAEAGKPVKVGLIGAGKFGSMYLSQAPRTPGIHLVGVADLSPDRARAALQRVGWEAERYSASSWTEAIRNGSTFITDDADAMIASDHVDIVIDATGSPAAGIHHALLCCQHRKHIVMVNVEADVLAGPLLARRAAEAGIIYSMASGDQPALIAELVDWARTTGFEVICAGKGTKYLPVYHQSTPDTVWGYYGFTRGTGRLRRLQRADVQLVPRRHEVRARNGGGRQCVRAASAVRRPRVPGMRRRRPAEPAASRIRRRHPAASRQRRSGVVAGTRRAAGVPRPALGRVRGLRGADRLRARLLLAIRPEDRQHGPLRRDVQAVSPDRARTGFVDREHRRARRSDGRDLGLSAATSRRPPSATCAQASASTAKAATPCTAS